MEPTTNRNKVYTILVLCFGVVMSVWIFQSKPKPIENLKQENKVEVTPIRNINETTNDDWEKILVTLDSKNKNFTNLTKNNENTFDETTVTGELSRDFLSQYLLLKQGGKTLTANEMNQIVTNLMQTKKYTKVTGAVYIPINLKIVGNDAQAVKNYKINVSQTMKTWAAQATDDPMLLINQTLGPSKTQALAKIDGSIKVGKGFIADFLKIEVPTQAILLHLDLLNTVSNLVADIEAMRELSNDPIRSIVGIGQYGKDLVALQTAIKKMNLYIVSN